MKTLITGLVLLAVLLISSAVWGCGSYIAPHPEIALTEPLKGL